MTALVLGPRVSGMSSRLRPAAFRIMRDWGVKQVANLKRAFLQGGHQRRGGLRWARVKRNLPPPILIKTGAMRAATSFNPAATKAGARATFINTAEYAAFHQFGTRLFPARKILVVTRRDEMELSRRLVFGLEKAVV